MNRLITFFFLALLYSPCSSLKGEKAGAFRVEVKDGLKVYWQEKLLVANDAIHLLGEEGLRKPDDGRSDTVKGFSVLNHWKMGDATKDVRWRREIAWNGEEVSGSMQFHVPPWFSLPHGGNCVYELKIPYETVVGMSYDGAAMNNVTTKVSGVLEAGMPDGPIGTVGALRYLAFSTPGTEGKESEKLLFDFAPAGPATLAKGGPTIPSQGCWVEKKGGYLLISSGGQGFRLSPHFGVWVPKWRVIEAGAEAYASLHAEENVAYFGQLPEVFQWSFGGGELSQRVMSAEYEEVAGGRWAALEKPFDRWVTPERSVWADAEKVSELGDRKQGVLHGRVQGEGANRLAFEVPEPGLYLFTLRVRAGEEKIGPGQIVCNGMEVMSDLEVQPGEVKVLTFPRYLEGRKGELEFSGDWAVSTLAAQALLYAEEDFVFQRGFWLVQDAPTPLPGLYAWKEKPLPFHTSVQTFREQQAKEPMDDRLFEKLRTAKAYPDNPTADWRYTGDIGGLGPMNDGSFHEFETDEAISRRLDEFEAAGFRTLLVNGFLFRLGWPEQHERVKETIARIVKIAHARGIRVIDHFDLTVVPNQGTGYRVLLERLGDALRDVRNGQVTRGYCINNPEFRKFFFSFLDDWIDRTGVDGLMLDEVAFHTRGFCGCPHCREKFLKDTGQVLPLDETAPELLNQESPLWKLWLAWRNQCVGDWFGDMRDEVRRKNEHFTLLYYAAPIGQSTSIFTRRPGGTTTDAVRGSDYLGTETISRNVYATWRSNLAHRAMYQSLRKAFNVPVFNLIYPQANPTVAYAGWIMNRMYAQPTWEVFQGTALIPERGRYGRWTGGFDMVKARSVASVAVLFSETSRDYSSEQRDFPKRMLGFCEQLGDWHLPYDVVLEGHVSSEELARYPLVVLPAAAALSDRTLELLRTYLEQGGCVMALGAAGSESVLGSRHPKWVLGDWIGLGLSTRKIKGPLVLDGEMGDPKVDHFAFSMPAVYRQNDAETEARVLAAAGPREAIAVAEGAVGKGTLMVVMPPLEEIAMEPEWIPGRIFEREDHDSTLLKRLVLRLLDHRQSLVPVQIPAQVVLTHFQQPGPDHKSEVYLHFFNATGVKLQQGQRVPMLPPKSPFPPVSGEILFEVALPFQGAAKAVMLSPDWEGERELELSEGEAGRVRVRIPGGSLHAYAVVRLCAQGEKE